MSRYVQRRASKCRPHLWLQRSQLLCHQPESDDGKVVIENASRIRARFMIAKLVASTADSLCRSARRKHSHDCSRSRGSEGRIFTVPGLEIESFHFKATSRLALRSRKVNVSMTTGTEV